MMLVNYLIYSFIMMPKKSVETSILLAIYNKEKELSKCIESIINQDYKNFELILVDDGSIDRSGAICDCYAKLDQRIRVIHKPHGGLPTVRNAGIEAANGKFVIFCDADDYMEEKWVSSLVNSITKAKSDFAYCNFKIIAKNKDNKIIYTSDYINKSFDFEINSETQLVKLIENEIYGSFINFNLWNKIFKLSIIKKYNIKSHVGDDVRAEDLALFLDYLLHCKSVSSSTYIGYCYVKIVNTEPNSRIVDGYHLNAMNEIGEHLCDTYTKYIKEEKNVSHFTVLYFLIMNLYYRRTKNMNYFRLRNEVKTIEDLAFFRAQLKLIDRYKSDFIRLYARGPGRQLMLHFKASTNIFSYFKYKIFKNAYGLYLKLKNIFH